MSQFFFAVSTRPEKYRRFSSILNCPLLFRGLVLRAVIAVAALVTLDALGTKSQHSFLPALFLETVCYGKLA